MADEPAERTGAEILQLMRSYQDFPHKREIWGDGPWADEPDELTFDAFGLQCEMRRNMGGCWTGYVCIPRGHPFYGLTLNQCGALDVHGGVTYGEHDMHSGRGAPTDVWWIGFDCGHGSDRKPRNEAMYRAMGLMLPTRQAELKDALSGERQWWEPLETYRTVDYAREQTEYLAAQLAIRGEGSGTQQAHAWIAEHYPEARDDDT